MTVVLFAKDLCAFPVAWVSGTGYREVKETALNFIRSAIRVAFAGGMIFAFYKGQYYYDKQRKFVIPVTMLSMTAARIPISVEPISVIINAYLIATSQSILRTGVYVCWLLAQLFTPVSFTGPRPFFSAAIKRDTSLKIDPYTIVAHLILNKVPEAQLGMGLYLSVFGISQLAAFTIARWNFKETPTELALKGILHLVIGLDCLGKYEKYSKSLEMGDEKKKSLIYKVADRASPWLAWVATGQWTSFEA